MLLKNLRHNRKITSYNRKLSGFVVEKHIKTGYFPAGMEQKISPWQILFYLSLSVFTLWFILKVTGVIQTPFWLEYGVPLITIVLTILSQYQHIMERMSMQYHQLSERIQSVTVSLAGLASKVDHIDRDVESLKKSASR
jgi:hypothetical protein